MVNDEEWYLYMWKKNNKKKENGRKEK